MSNQKMYEKANRLANEKSPYLLQHAHNPVDWFSWSDEAFEKAKKHDKPIFLSIGYSTCHWCHVMERESFEDDEVAKILNDYFVAIKVDKEERPDIDSIYMNVCQGLTGSGGWPLTIIMTPEKKPFFAGTYIPKKAKYGYTGLIDLLLQVKDAWKDKREELVESSNVIVEEVKKISSYEKNEGAGKDAVFKAYKSLARSFDKTYGGFGNAPKFPIPHNLYFLLRYYKLTGEEQALNMVEKTLNSMYKGGIFDHIGNGFSRYSVDRRWLVPHFEKMLYDNAMLAIAYLETYQMTHKEFYKEVSEKIFIYVLREMKSKEGGFYSAEDADSEGVEGKFYVWGKNEIIGILGNDDAEFFSKFYDITGEGNFEEKNIPNLIKTDIKEIENNKDIKSKLDSIKNKLFDYRESKVHPHKDDKVLTAWNGLMIAALAYGGRVLDSDRYIEASEEAAQFILNNLVRDDGRLLARYRDGEAAFLAYLDDYAFFIWGLIELYESTFNEDYLLNAIRFNDDMLKLFWDEKDGGLFIYGNDGEKLIMRPKESYDGAIPSGNSVAALNIVSLSRITENEKLSEKAEKIFKYFGSSLNSESSGHTFMLTALMSNITGGQEIVISGNIQEDTTKRFLKEINDRFLPFSSIILKENNSKLNEIIPSIKEKASINDKTTVYICKNFSCSEPIVEVDELKSVLEVKERF